MKRALTMLGLALSAAVSSLLTATPAQAWWETGHMVTAQVAYQQLKPEVRKEADRLIQVLAVVEPDPLKNHFVPAAVWMDHTKARGLGAFDEWHYINIPYNPEGLPEVTDAHPTNVVVILERMLKTLSSEKTTDFEKAFALRIVLHLVGDIHQPFHAVGKVSHTYPDGDRGGNRTKVHDDKVENIHYFWDSTAGLFGDVKPEAWQQGIPSFAETVMKQHPASKYTGQLEPKPADWATESYKLAVKYGYMALPANGEISPEFRKNVQQICAERLALGGYRLAEILNRSLK